MCRRSSILIEQEGNEHTVKHLEQTAKKHYHLRGGPGRFIDSGFFLISTFSRTASNPFGSSCNGSSVTYISAPGSNEPSLSESCASLHTATLTSKCLTNFSS